MWLTRLKHTDFEILRIEDQYNSLNISDIVEERELDVGNTSNFNSGHPCPLCQNHNFCCWGVCDECEYMNTEEGMNTHIMNQHEPSDVVKGLGQQWAKDRLSLVYRNQDNATDWRQSAKWDKLYLWLKTILHFLIFIFVHSIWPNRSYGARLKYRHTIIFITACWDPG